MDDPSGIRRRAARLIERVASILPTVRGRLSALVGMALLPALAILAYDEWLARKRGFDALADVSTRVCRLMERELNDRIARAASRLETLTADPDVIAASPAAGRKLVDAMRDDRIYNNLLIADGTTGEVRTSAVPLDRPASVSRRVAYQRARRTLGFAGAFLPEPATGEPELNVAQPAVNEIGVLTAMAFASLDLDGVTGFIERSGLPSSTVLTVLDDSGVVQYRSAELEKYVGKTAGPLTAALAARDRAGRGRQRPRGSRDGSGRALQVRSHPDGHSDAGAGWPRGDPCAACGSALCEAVDDRDDGQRHAVRPRGVPRCRHERSRYQAHRSDGARCGAAAVAARSGDRSIFRDCSARGPVGTGGH